jgi:hypothetical protein
MALIEKYGLYLTNERQWDILAFEVWKLEQRFKRRFYRCVWMLIAPRTFCICAAVCWAGIQGLVGA